jgi:hypothetical protein
MSYIYHVCTVPETAHYFGKESVMGSRWRGEISLALKGETTQRHFFNWIRKYWSSPDHEFVVERMEVSDDVWQAVERFVIAWGRVIWGRENVTNIADGGEGAKWDGQSEDCRRRALEAQNRPEVRAANSRKQKEAQNRPEVKMKKSKAIREALAKPEVRERTSLAIRRALSEPEAKARRGAIQREIAKRPEVIARRRRVMSSIWADRERSAKLRESMREGWARRRARLGDQ